MDTIHLRTTVLAGHRIEITAPDLSVGDDVDVTVVRQARDRSERPRRRPMLDIVASLNGHRHFQTPGEVDAYIREERDSWER